MENAAEKVRKGIGCIWGAVCDYYSMVPFRRIILFNLTVPLALRIVLALVMRINTVIIYIAANGVFYLFCMKKHKGEFERADKETVVKRLVLTAVADVVSCGAVSMAFLIHFILNIDLYTP
ncbi:MAG: hypothetical protein NC078_08950 [Ruminococcus sp.]|nr:hypothetical protein [Ruminococcus sp.]